MKKALRKVVKLFLGTMLASSLLMYGTAALADVGAARSGTDSGSEIEAGDVSASTMAAAASALSVTSMGSTLTKEGLVQSLLGGGVTVSNIVLKSTPLSAGKFTGGEGIIGFDEGIILSTGKIADVVGPNRSVDNGATNNLPADNDLNKLVVGSQTYDATVLEFDFIPEHDIISFQYVFSSKEYNQFVNQTYNDVFGFFINGKNAALIPGTTIPVSINTVNGGNPIGVNAKNPQYYINNTGAGSAKLNTNMNGLTVVFPVQVEVNKGVINHIKMAIADVADTAVDSNVFIKAGSFTDKPIDYPPVVAAAADRDPNVNGWYNDDVTVTFTATDDDETPVSSVDPPVVVSAEGADQLIAGTATDTAGHTGTGSILISLDKTAPITVSSATPAETNGWNNTDVEVTLNAMDHLSGVETTQYRINGGPWHEYSGPITLSAEGSHVVDYYSTDLAGNVEAVKSKTVNVDKTAPVTSVASTSPSIGANGWNNSAVTVFLTADDSGSAIASTQFRLNGGNWQDYNGSITVAEEGVMTIEYRSLDNAGNMEEIRSLALKIDKTAPVTSASASLPGANGWYTVDAVVSLTATDDGSGTATTQYRINEGSWLNYITPVTLSSDGIYLLEYQSIDHAGNMEEIKNMTLKVDKTAPTFTITANGSPLSNGAVFKSSQTVTLALQAADNLSGVAQTSITVDGKPYTPGVALDWAGKMGTHTINIVVTDQAGNKTQSQLNVSAATGFDVIRQLIERFAKSGELGGPMLVQLSNSLTQAESQFNKAHLDQSIKSMNDFLKHIGNKALQSHISANAKQILINEMNALIQFYSK